MSLTGIPLIVVAVLATLLAAAGTVVTWRCGGRLRVLSRSGAVLLTEALLLLTAGVVVNRSEQFYPTWAALSSSARTSGTTFAVTPGNLDGWLRGNGPAFTWKPPGWTGWHLAGAPLVVVPQGYLDHPKWRYSAVVVAGDSGSGWTSAGDAVVVFARTTAATRAEVLADELPAALAHDLRVTGQRWALVAGPSEAGLAHQAVLAAPARYPAIAVLPGTGQHQTSPPLPVGITVATAADRPASLQGALTWAADQTPPPLAASTPTVAALPVQHPKHHHRPKLSSSRTGEMNVPRQPGH